MDSIQSDLHTAILPRLHRSVDVLLFNPPYVPTEDSEEAAAQQSADIAGSWAGGLTGMNVTDRVLGAVDVSSERGHRVC